MLLGTAPGAGWQLLVGAYPSSRGFVLDRRPPSWRPWGQDESPEPTQDECRTFIGQMTTMLLNDVGSEADRWADLVGIIARFSPEDRDQAIDLLSQRVEALIQHPAVHSLWTRLREVLHHHRSYPDAAWAMDIRDLAALEAVYEQLTPVDPAVAYARLFDGWPDLPEGRPHDHNEATKRIAEARQTAVRAAYGSGGVSAILGIAEAAEEPHQVGVAVALGIGPELALDLAVNHLGSTATRLRNMAHGALRSLFPQSGWKTLEEVIIKAKASGSTPQALADIYLAAPTIRDTWQRLHDEDQEVQSAYWKSIGRPNTSEWDVEDHDLFVEQLLSVRRSVDALNLLAFEPMSHEMVIRILEAIPADVETSAHIGPHVDSFRLAHLFKKLDQSDDVPDNMIASLEIPYLGILDQYRPQLALHRRVVREPSLFADVIAQAFRRADGEAEESVDDHMLERRASAAFNVLWKLRLLPGLMDDGSVSAEALSTWVNESRRMCRERDRKDIGDQQIGQTLANAPVGEDGVWPCEPVRDLLDDLASRHVGIGFTNGKRNLRGVTSRGVFDGGGQERSLVDKYRQDADKIRARWPFTAQLLRQLAGNYEAEARRHDQRADWSDQFES